MPFFSIVIPTYNRVLLIETTIRSVLSQTFQDFEILIIDDGSTDNTNEIVELITSKKITYRKQINRERGAARNTGIEMANGNYVTFLDSDDLFYSTHLQTAFDFITSNNYPKILHTRYEIITSEGNVIEQKQLLDERINKKLISGNFMSCNGVFLRNDIAQQNKFNENRNLSALEDWELWLRIASRYEIKYSNTITSAIVHHDSRSVLNTNKTELILRINTLLKNVLENSSVVNYYKGELYKFKASCYTYIALHLALTKKNRITTFKYLLKGMITNASIIFTKRFYVILKHFF